MSRVKSKNEVVILEINDVGQGGEPILVIESHWENDDYVVIEIVGADRVTVDGNDLRTAIRNAQNTG